MKKITLEQAKDRFIGVSGTPKRDQYEFDLKIALIGEAIKKIRQERNLTQEQLGKLIGVQKAQISKLESGNKNVTINTLLKIFNALGTNVKFQIDTGSVNYAL